MFTLAWYRAKPGTQDACVGWALYDTLAEAKAAMQEGVDIEGIRFLELDSSKIYIVTDNPPEVTL